VFPETAIIENLWENDLSEGFSLGMLRTFISKMPNVSLLSGASTYRAYLPGEKLTPTARKMHGRDGYHYDAFNTAIMLNNANDSIQVYHKSKLVPGVEKMPFPSLLKPLEDFAIDLGGTSGSLGGQDNRSVFKGGKIKAGPIVCYESVYGEFVTDYVNNGANLLCIITNDGWWGDTPGYKQHKDYGRLRAIETRRSIVRSANTGISCFYDQLGNTTQETGWWVPAVIEGDVYLNSKETFYVRYGDYLAWMAVYGVVILLVLLIAKPFINKRKV
jgi:apolipoprotein N-acyltransferase